MSDSSQNGQIENTKNVNKTSSKSINAQRSLAEIMLTAFIWRVYTDKFSELIIKIVATSDSAKSMIKNDVNLLVKSIFDTKQSILLVVDEISKICNKWLITLMKNKKEIIKQITNKYIALDYNMNNENHNKKVNPTAEYDSYLHMIQVAQMDWNSVRAHIKVIVDDYSINSQTFYTFMNEAADFAKDEKISIVAAVSNTHIRQKLAAIAARRLQPDPMWYANITSQFNQAKYYESMNVIKYYNQNNGDIVNKQNQYPNGPTFRNDQTHQPYEPYVNKRKQRQDKRLKFRNEIIAWVKEIRQRLKPEWREKFVPNNWCYRHHKKGSTCRSGSQPNCTTGEVTRTHACLCGNSAHTIGECRTIFKV